MMHKRDLMMLLRTAMEICARCAKYLDGLTGSDTSLVGFGPTVSIFAVACRSYRVALATMGMTMTLTSSTSALAEVFANSIRPAVDVEAVLAQVVQAQTLALRDRLDLSFSDVKNWIVPAGPLASAIAQCDQTGGSFRPATKMPPDAEQTKAICGQFVKVDSGLEQFVTKQSCEYLTYTPCLIEFRKVIQADPLCGSELRIVPRGYRGPIYTEAYTNSTVVLVRCEVVGVLGLDPRWICQAQYETDNLRRDPNDNQWKAGNSQCRARGRFIDEPALANASDPEVLRQFLKQSGVVSDGN